MTKESSIPCSSKSGCRRITKIIVCVLVAGCLIGGCSYIQKIFLPKHETIA